MAYWVKLRYERDTYLINLDRISAFCFAANSKLKFWLPESGTVIIIHPQANLEDYQKVLEYIKKATTHSLGAYWVKPVYEREEYVVDLARISAFSCAPGSGKITLWLPDSRTCIVIHPQSNPEDYYKVLNYIEKTTGYTLP